jgi:hypothetical protein
MVRNAILVATVAQRNNNASKVLKTIYFYK